MIGFLKSIPRHHKVIIQNFSYLTLFQISNYIFPIITLPYLVRVLGPQNFGLVNFAIAFVTYFGLISDYGFKITATRQISINRNDQIIISRIFNSVLILRLILLFLSFLIFLAILFFVPLLKAHFQLHLIAFMMIVGQAIFPNWFFQGIEQMKYITLLNVSVKALSTVLIFFFVVNEDSYFILILIYSLSAIGVGILSLIIILLKFKIKFKLPSYEDLKKQLVDGFHVFASMISISLYTNTNTFILGLIAGNTAVGYFIAADKIRMAFQGVFSQIGQSVFPYLSQLYFQSLEYGVNFSKKLIKYAGIIILICSLGIFVFAPIIVKIVLGPNYEQSVLVLRIISFLPFIIFLSNVAGIQTMLNIGMQKQFLYIIFCAGMLNVILLFILVPIIQEIGVSISVVITELVVTIGIFIYLKRKKVNLL